MSAIKKEKKIEYPYLPEGRTIEYCSKDYPAMLAAKKVAVEKSLDENVPTGSAIEVNNEIIGLGANGSNYHKENGCERIKRGIPTGQGYELCEGCHPKNHSERKAINSVPEDKKSLLKNATLYLWGHWWCCKDCWDAIIESGISRVVLQEDSEKDFNKDDPHNVIGETKKYRQEQGWIS